MSVQATYELCVDLNRDRDFVDASEDISAYWMDMSWQLGAIKPFDVLARANTFEATLKNSDNRFSPGHASALTGFDIGALVRLRSTYSATTRQHFIGWITDIRPAPDVNGQRTTQIRAEGFFGRLLDVKVALAVQQGKRYDEIATALLEAARVIPPGFTGWLLGDTSALGVTTILGTTSDYSQLAAGVNTFNYAGDNWARGVSVASALKDLMTTERGLIYETRQGYIAGFNRHYWYLDMLNAVDATFTGADLLRGGIDYQYGVNIANDVTVRFHPRTAGTALETLGTIQQSVPVPARGSATTRLAFDDGSGNRIGGYGVVCVKTTDYGAYTQSDGRGQNVTSDVFVSIAEGGNSCELRFTNTGRVDAFIAAGSRVRGYKITDFGEQAYRAVDEASSGAYGLSEETLSLTMLDDPEYARNLALWELIQRSSPQQELTGITIQANVSDTLMTQALSRVIGDRIKASEAQTGVTEQELFIIGEKHRVVNAKNHRVNWFLRPSRPLEFWVMEDSTYGKLGQTSELAL